MALGEPADIWPTSVKPDFTNADVGIARTRPATETREPVREVEQLFLDAIDAAERTIYIENPERPIEARAFIASVLGDGAPHVPMRTVLKVAAALMGIIALTLIWHLTPLSSQLDPETLETTLASLAGSPWSPLIVVAVFVGGGLVAFPVNLLIAATAAAFGPFLGFAYAAMGILASALVTYVAGAWIGRKALMNLVGPRLSRIRNSLARRGVLPVATVRMVPLAPPRRRWRRSRRMRTASAWRRRAATA